MGEANLDAVLEKIQKLLAKSESSTFPAEAAAFREKAELMMREYRVKEENLIAKDQFSLAPITRVITLLETDSDFYKSYWLLFRYICDHTGVISQSRWVYNPVTRETELGATMVGYESDIGYAEMLWLSARLAFLASIEPDYNPKISIEENIYILRSSGLPRKDVAEKIWGHWTQTNSAKVAKIYKEECARRGEEPALNGRQVSAKTYREVFAREFVWRVYDRLQEARDAALKIGGALDLSGRADRVQEAFWVAFPDLRPDPEPESPPTSETSGKKPRKKLPEWETVAGRAKFQRLHNSPAALAGRAAGINAGDKVAIRGIETTERIEGGE